MISANLPTRLHHNAYVTADMEAARHFCEDLIGLPLVATWCEADELFGKERVYCHCFFGLADDSALAFFSVRPLGRPEPVRTENVVLAIPSHRVKLRCSHAKRGTEVPGSHGLSGAEPVCARAAAGPSTRPIPTA